jgi:hypothetical protein
MRGSIAAATRFRGRSRARQVGSHLVLDASQRTSRGHRAGQADGQPRHPVPQASAHCFLAGGSGVRSGGQKAAEPVKILVVFPEQDAVEPLGRIRAWKWLYSLTTATPGSPASTLAMRPAPDAVPGATTGASMSITSASTASAGAARSSSIEARPTRRPFVHTATTMALSKVDPRIPSHTAHPPDTLLGPSHGRVANRVSGGGADRLVELLGQTVVRKRVSRYLMTARSVVPPMLDTAARVFGPLSRWDTRSVLSLYRLAEP